MTTQPSFIIVGGGLAGAITAETLREEGFDGRITLLGEEPHHPCERPPLSKDYLQGKADRDSIFAHPEAWYADDAVELRLGTAVTSLDRRAGDLERRVGPAGQARALCAHVRTSLCPTSHNCWV
jgi:3-phenylpropionate/trans-cinnamate dioxygenase ferredoxin reductase subunit